MIYCDPNSDHRQDKLYNVEIHADVRHVTVDEYPLVDFIAVRKKANEVGMPEPGHRLYFFCEISFALPC